MMMKISILKIPKPLFPRRQKSSGHKSGIPLLVYSFIFLYFVIVLIPPKEILISFDTESFVGDEEVTNKILDILFENNVTATFFVMGEFAIQNPEIMQRIKNGNHEIACHTQTHKNLLLISKEEQEEEIIFCKESIKKTVNVTVVGFRAPWRLLDFSSVNTLKSEKFMYDASLFDIQPNIYQINEVFTSTYLGFIPADDYILLTFFKIPKKMYFFMIKNIYDKKISLSFHPHIIKSHLEEFKELIKYYNQRDVKFLTHKESLK